MNELIKKYAALAVGTGTNLKKGQKLVINCPVECADFAVALTEAAFECGASDVEVFWSCRRVNRRRYLSADAKELNRVPDYIVAQRMENLDKGAAYIAVDADDPSLFSDVDPKVIADERRLYDEALKEWFDVMLGNGFQWCVVAVPTQAWASKVFPNDAQCFDKLTQAIANAVRLYADDPVAAWNSHADRLVAYGKWLNECEFDSLRYKNSLGTDIVVGLPKGHIWAGGEDRTKGGHRFIANMPTEEVFTAPDRNRVNGVLKSSMPLSHNGALVENFSLTFTDGEVTDYSAEKGQDVLKHLFENDEGARHLGEVALVPCDSPIAEMGLLFYNTLFDENAACHFALGSAYSTSIKNGESMDDEQLVAHGLNVSLTHVDFMVGTKDLSITGIKADGTELPVFINGKWAK